MILRKQIIAILLALMLVPAFTLAQEKKATVAEYESDSRMLTVKGKDWEQKAKVGSKLAEEKADLLKADTKVLIEFDDRGGGDVRVKSLNPR